MKARSTWGTSPAGDCMEVTVEFLDDDGKVIYTHVANYLSDNAPPVEVEVSPAGIDVVVGLTGVAGEASVGGVK